MNGVSRRALLIVLCLFVILFALYVTLFRPHQVGPRTITVNGVDVEHVSGFSLRGTTWLSRQQTTRFLLRIHATGVNLPSVTWDYRGQAYVKLPDVIRVLQSVGDDANTMGQGLSVRLKPAQHYTYTANGDTVFLQEVRVGKRVDRFVLALEHEEATFEPRADIARALDEGGLVTHLDQAGQSLLFNHATIKSRLSIQNPSTYTALTVKNGRTLYAENYAWNGNDYIPMQSLSAAIDVMGWRAKFNSWQVTVGERTGGLTATREPRVAAFVPFYFGQLGPFHDATGHPHSYNAVANDVWTVDAGGNLVGNAPSGTAQNEQLDGDAAFAMVSNLGSSGADAAEMTLILHNAARTKRLIDGIDQLVMDENYDGATLDFELMAPADRTWFTQFVDKLAERLHANGRQLDVVVPPDTGATSEPWNGAYDQAMIGRVADQVTVMAYDYSYPGGLAGPIAPVPWVQATLAYTLSRVPSGKVVLGIDTYGYDWSSGHSTVAVGLPNLDAFLLNHHIKPKWDTSAGAPWFTWKDSKGTLHTVYYDDARSLSLKLELAKQYGLNGVAVWRAGLEDAPVLNLLAQFRANSGPYSPK